MNIKDEIGEFYNQILVIVLSVTAFKYIFIVVKEVLYFSWWFTRNILFIMTGNYQQVGRLFDDVDARQIDQQRADFLNLFHHLKPAASKEIVDIVLGEVLTNVCEEFQEDSSKNNEEGWENEVAAMEKDLYNEVNDSGYFDGDLSMTS